MLRWKHRQRKETDCPGALPRIGCRLHHSGTRRRPNAPLADVLGVSVKIHKLIICSALICALGPAGAGVGQSSVRAATRTADGTMIGLRPAAVATPRAAPRAPAVSAPIGNPLWTIPLRSMSATRERPLFSPSRRPPPAVVATAPPPPPPAQLAPPPEPQLTLIGTVLGAGRGIGVFLDKTTKVIVRLSTGEGHDGWMLRAVQRHAVILERDRRDVTLALPGSKPAEQATASIPTPTAAPTPPAAAQEPRQETSAPPGRWRDGDGQVITPPAINTANVDSRAAGTWVDGDGRRIETPATRSAPAAPATWLDGDGQLISAPGTKVTHGSPD